MNFLLNSKINDEKNGKIILNCLEFARNENKIQKYNILSFFVVIVSNDILLIIRDEDGGEGQCHD